METMLTKCLNDTKDNMFIPAYSNTKNLPHIILLFLGQLYFSKDKLYHIYPHQAFMQQKIYTDDLIFLKTKCENNVAPGTQFE